MIRGNWLYFDSTFKELVLTGDQVTDQDVLDFLLRGIEAYQEKFGQTPVRCAAHPICQNAREVYGVPIEISPLLIPSHLWFSDHYETT